MCQLKVRQFFKGIVSDYEEIWKAGTTMVSCCISDCLRRHTMQINQKMLCPPSPPHPPTSPPQKKVKVKVKFQEYIA